MYGITKKPFFLNTARVLVLFYVAAILQLYGAVSCVCAETDAGDYEKKAVSVQDAAVVQCCCSAKSDPDVDGLSNNRFDGSSAELCGVQNPRCCVSNNDSWDPDARSAVISTELPLNIKDVFRTLTPSFYMGYGLHGAYSKGYYAEVVSISVSRHIASTILLL